MLKDYFRKNPRIAGLFLTVISLVLDKFTMFDVITDAQAHAADVSISMKGVTLTIVFFLLGLTLFITGPVGAALLNKAPGTRKLPLLGWVLVFVIVGAGFGGYFLFQNYISSFGYKF